MMFGTSFQSAREWLEQNTVCDLKKASDSAAQLVFPENKSLEEARRNSHLTHSTSFAHQIRFSLRSRVSRELDLLANIYAQQLPENAMRFLDLTSPLDEGSRELAKKIHSLRPDIHFENRNIIKPALHAALPQFQEAAEAVYRGDYWWARTVLKNISERTAQIEYLRGLVCTHFDDTLTSELHFKLARHTGGVADKVKANYVLSMLYLRHHPTQHRCVNKAHQYLEEAWSILCAEENLGVFDEFDRVFNRNGAALIAFRERRISEAISMLTWGINRLDERTDGSVPLHKSVLIYNLAQCYRALKMADHAISEFQRLVHLDPLMIEYRIELANEYESADRVEDAIAELHEALKIEPGRVEALNLGAYLYAQKNNFTQAHGFAAQAWMKEQSEETLFNLVYCLLQLGRPVEARELMSIFIDTTGERISDRIMELQIEALLQLPSRMGELIQMREQLLTQNRLELEPLVSAINQAIKERESSCFV
jgi:tetratricopeptide (TPR) repeat protein